MNDKVKYDDKIGYDPELVVDATPASDNGSSIPPNHSRFFCEKCRAVSSTVFTFLYYGSLACFL